MFPHSASTRLLSAGLLDKQQIEEGERLRRLGETQRRGASALLSPGLASPATDPLTEGFFGTSLFGRLVSRRQSRRDSEASGAAEAGGRSRRGSWAANTELVSVLDREQLATPRDTRCRPAPPRTAVMCDVCCLQEAELQPGESPGHHPDQGELLRPAPRPRPAPP